MAKDQLKSSARGRFLKQGFLKALVEENGDRILGFAASAVEAGEIMGSVQIAMIAGLPYTTLREAILTHPTIIEGLNFLFAAVPSAPSQSPVGSANPEIYHLFVRMFCNRTSIRQRLEPRR